MLFTNDFTDSNILDPKSALEKGNTFKSLYDKYKSYDTILSSNDDYTLRIMELEFITNDLKLYLDIHDDKNAQRLYNTYLEELKTLEDDYV